jgi:predicted nucleotidyltransferase
MQNRILEALRRAVRFLEHEGIPFVVTGGLANAVWGEPRTTRDVDLKVYIGERSAKEFANLVAREFAPATPIPGGPTLIVSIAVLPDVTVDFLIAIPGYEEEVLARAQPVHFGEMTLSVCSPEDFIIHKVIADRPKDWADVEGVLIEQRDRLDQEYIRTWLAQFAEVLERPDWPERYENLVQRLVS